MGGAEAVIGRQPMVAMTLRYEEACELFRLLRWERPKVTQHEVSCAVLRQNVTSLEARLRSRLAHLKSDRLDPDVDGGHFYLRGERACRMVHIERLIQRLQRLRRIA